MWCQILLYLATLYLYHLLRTSPIPNALIPKLSTLSSGHWSPLASLCWGKEGCWGGKRGFRSLVLLWGSKEPSTTVLAPWLLHMCTEDHLLNVKWSTQTCCHCLCVVHIMSLLNQILFLFYIVTRYLALEFSAYSPIITNVGKGLCPCHRPVERKQGQLGTWIHWATLCGGLETRQSLTTNS